MLTDEWQSACMCCKLTSNRLSLFTVIGTSGCHAAVRLLSDMAKAAMAGGSKRKGDKLSIEWDVVRCCQRTNDHKADVKLDVGVANAVVAGGSSARVLDLTGAEIKDIPAEAVELPIGQSVFSVAWSPDSQLLTVSTTVSHWCMLLGVM